MLSKSRLIKLVAILMSAVFLSQCMNVAKSQLHAVEKKERTTATALPYPRSATAYLALAKNQPETEQQNWLILAAGRFIYDGQWRDGIRTLAQTRNLTPEQTSTKTILLAKTDLIKDQPRSAIARLASVREINSLPPFYQVQYHEILALAYDFAGNHTESAVERIALEHLMSGDAERAENRRSLWLTLTKLPSAELNTLAVEATDNSELQGWMKLALLARERSRDAQVTLAKIEQWRQKYHDHPANSLLPSSISALKPLLHGEPKQLALLLPLSGPLAGPGGAVRDGFMAAARDSSAKIRVYDTARGDVSALYSQALKDGADYVVGPLSKTDVARVAAMDHPVPTLLLNDVDNASTNAYHFGLSPGNEAKQVAVQASKKGYKHALIIAPAGAWGDEIVRAFSSQWGAGGGIVVDQLSYNNNQDLNEAIRNLLHITDSQDREKQLKQLLGSNIQMMPRRRQDFDIIFLLAYPSKARQIMPLLKYYFAGNIPVYATSSVYAGTPDIMKDKDLDGIIFSDMPWVFTNQMSNKNWPEQLNSYSRLYALGMDSFALASQLNQLLLFPAMGINDKSGVLYLNNTQQIARIPAWGQFRGGVAVARS